MLFYFPALPGKFEESEHWHHHLPQLRQARASSGLTRHHGSRDGTQLWIAGKINKKEKKEE